MADAVKQQVSLWIDSALYKRVKMRSAENDVTIGEFLHAAIRQALSESVPEIGEEKKGPTKPCNLAPWAPPFDLCEQEDYDLHTGEVIPPRPGWARSHPVEERRAEIAAWVAAGGAPFKPVLLRGLPLVEERRGQDVGSDSKTEMENK